VLSATAKANYRVNTNTNNITNEKPNEQKHNKINNKKQRKMDRLSLLRLKHELLQISVYLQTESTAETRLVAGQWLQERVNVVKLRMFRAGTQGRLF
jgi:hypothetical protein